MGLGFILLLLIIYYRNRIIRNFFAGVIQEISLISVATAQENSAEMPNILSQKVILDEVEFSPSISLEGFNVISNFDITKISCETFSNEIHQLAILLYPPESMNEKFLIKVRDCLLKLKEDHPLKRWLKWVAKPTRPGSEDKELAALTEVTNSQFNLITDPKLKYKIIQSIAEIKENSIYEKLLRSYLFLMIGNVTKSDNIIRSITNEKPFLNWAGFGHHPSKYFLFAKANLSKIFQKHFNHPADRRSVELFGLYISSFYNNKALLELVDEYKNGIEDSVLALRYVEKLSPSLVHFFRLSQNSEKRRIKNLKNLKKHTLEEQAYWIWPFMKMGPLKTEDMLSELKRIEKDDNLWFIFLMNDERTADWYAAKTQKSFLSSRRKYLRSLLENEKLFMLALYKIIESGDIDAELVTKVSTFLTHE